jgi:hypothetical protein
MTEPLSVTDREYLVWVAGASNVFHVLPHGMLRERAHNLCEWTREFAEDGLEARPCRNGCFESDGALTREAAARVLAHREAGQVGEQVRAVTEAWNRHFGEGSDDDARMVQR